MSRNPVFYKIGKGLFKAEIKTYDLGVECFEQVMMVTECYLECESESPFLMFTLLYIYVWVPWEGFNVLIFNILHPVL